MTNRSSASTPASRNDERRARANVTDQLNTPVEVPVVSAEVQAWEARAVELKRAGYNAAVVARKLIDQHAAPVAEAERIVGQLFGKRVDAFAGETTSAIVGGLVIAAAGVVGVGVLLAVFGGVHRVRIPLLGVPMGLIFVGLGRAFIAFVNRNVPPTEGQPK